MQVGHSQDALDGVVEEEEIGSRTVIEVLNAKQELVTAQVNLTNAHHDFQVATLQVRAAIGEMTAESLGLPVELYDPSLHYNEVRGKLFGTGTVPGE
ncbi:MAG: TolC family protein [Rhodospirillaceae bacterium]|nr:TolC family protein [Rhodospirillales bacterium]